MSFNIVSGGVVRVIHYHTITGQVATVKRDWQCVSISGGANVPSAPVLDKFASIWSPVILDAMTEQADYYGSQMYYQTPVGPKPRPETNKAYAGIGVDVSPPLPTQTSGLVSLYSDVLGKSGQGRIYVPFPSVLASDVNGTPTALYNTVLGNIGTISIAPTTVIDGGITAIFNPVLYIPGGDPPKQLTHYIARDAWATQRRRGSFGRLNSTPF